MRKLPGLIDPHVHVREPGQTHKEDWDTATAAALSGGFTAILAMPNTRPPTFDRHTLEVALRAAAQKAHCDYAQYLGAGPQNAAEVSALAGHAAGLKMYLDSTFGELRLDDMTLWMTHFRQWRGPGPIVLHAENRSMAAALALAHIFDQRVHIAHVSLAEVRPRLATRRDVAALWANLDVIDCFATDHAPHTLAEKDGDNPPPGFPGLETALPLLMTAVQEGRLTWDALIEKMYTNPRRIFHLPVQEQTWIEVDEAARWEIHPREMHSRAGWTPFEGWRVTGRVRRVVLRGQEAFRDGEILSSAGNGQNLRAALPLHPNNPQNTGNSIH